LTKKYQSMDFDPDQKQAVTSRFELLIEYAIDCTIVSGLHPPFPGMGKLTSDREKGYTWLPVKF